MLNYNKINDLFSNNTNTNEHFYASIKVTRLGFKQTIDNKSMKVETLERIAIYFKKPVSWFFDEEPQQLASQEDSGTDYKALYLQTLEKYTLCLEENKSIREAKPGKVIKASKDVHKL